MGGFWWVQENTGMSNPLFRGTYAYDANGYPEILTIDRPSAKNNRRASLKGIDKIPGKDLDEYPPAMSREGGKGASVRAINSSGNRESGSSAGDQLRGYPNGTKYRYNITK